MSDYQFALPGLMELQTPLSDELPVMLRLEPHTQSDTDWQGVVTLGPVTINGFPPELPAASAVFEFCEDSDLQDPTYTLSTEDVEGNGTLNITDAPTWWFEVPSQDLPLCPNLWYWVFKVTDTAGEAHVVYRGTIVVTP